MRFLWVFLFIGVSQASRQCQRVDTIDVGSIFAQRQPVYLNLLPKTPENALLDNVCLTYYPVPDDPYSYIFISARVYCDGSLEVESFGITPISKGITRIANPMQTVTDHIVGYSGCETYLVYRCSNFGQPFEAFNLGATFDYKPLGLSCLRKIEEIIRDKNLPDDELYVLPMKLPSRCVTQRQCSLPPNPFNNQLNLVNNYYGSTLLY